MKLVTAIIQPDKLDQVREALIKAEITRITVSRCSGRGQAGQTDLYRGQVVAPDLINKVRIDIACNEEFVDTTVNAILSSAKHGPEGVREKSEMVKSLLPHWINVYVYEPAKKAATRYKTVI